MDVAKESIDVARLDDGRLVIHYLLVYANGLSMGGDLTFEEVNAPWLIEKLELAADDNLHDTHGEFPPDHLVVYVRGGERGESINVNVGNRREGTGPLGLGCGFCIVTPELAKEAAAHLRRLIGASNPDGMDEEKPLG